TTAISSSGRCCRAPRISLGVPVPPERNVIMVHYYLYVGEKSVVSIGYEDHQGSRARIRRSSIRDGTNPRFHAHAEAPSCTAAGVLVPCLSRGPSHPVRALPRDHAPCGRDGTAALAW